MQTEAGARRTHGVVARHEGLVDGLLDADERTAGKVVVVTDGTADGALGRLTVVPVHAGTDFSADVTAGASHGRTSEGAHGARGSGCDENLTHNSNSLISEAFCAYGAFALFFLTWD
jgi:hypothetical protein